MRKAIVLLFNIILILIPFIFYPWTTELFEFNKMVATYAATALISGFWITRMINEKKFIFRRTIADIPLLIFISSQLISTLLSIDTRTSIFGYYSRFNGGILSSLTYLILYWAYVSNINAEETKKILRNALISALLISVYGVLEHFGASISCLIITGEFNNGCWVQDVGTRVFATLGQPNWLASYLIAVIPVGLVFAIFQKEKSKRIIWTLVTSLLFLCVLFTKSRSGLLGLAVADSLFVSLIIFSLLREKTKKLSNVKDKLMPFVLANIIVVLVIGIFGSPWTPSLVDLLKEKTTEVKNDSAVTSLDQGGTESGDIRKIVWGGAINIWRAYPIFGSGPETFAFTYYQYRPKEHNLVSEWDFLYNKAHNEYLNFAANTGTVGIVSYLTLIGFFLYLMFFGIRKGNIKDDEGRYLKFALISGFSSILVTNFFGFSVVVTQLLFFLIPAMSYSLTNTKVTEDSEKNLDSAQKIANIVILIGLLYALFTIYKYWSADLAYNRGKSQLTQGEVGPAVDSLTKAIRKSPNEPLYHDKIAQLYGQLAAVAAEDKDASLSAELVALAVSETETAHDLAPRNFVILQNRINVYSDLSRANPDYTMEVIKSLESLTTYAPNYAKTYYKLALYYIDIGQTEKGIQNLNRALELKPNYPEAKVLLEKTSNL